MNKKELIAKMADCCELNKKETEKALVAFINAVTEALSMGEKIQLVGFGVFEVCERSERVGRNPATGEPMTFAASKYPRFKAGKKLKDAINA